MDISNNINTAILTNNENINVNDKKETPIFKVGDSSHSFDVKENHPNGSAEHLRKISLEEFKKLEATPSEMTPVQSWQFSQFMMTEAYSDYRKEQSLENGKLRQTQRVITIGNERIIYKDGSTSMTNNMKQYFVSGDREATLENIYAAFGKNQVEVTNFAKGESPTNSELFEQLTGKNYYRHIMSDGRFG
jgi:hypothetical protein